MDAAVLSAMASLAIRDVPRQSPAEVREWLASFGGAIGDRDRSLLLAMCDMRSGAPRNAARLLAGDAGVLSRAIDVAAALAERNRFPGGRGSVMEEGDIDTFEEAPVPDLSNPTEAALTIAIAHVDAMVSNWRSISGQRQGVAPALARVDQLRTFVSDLSCPWVAAYLELVEADLRRLGRDAVNAEAAFGRALAAYEQGGDTCGAAACYVALGDWNSAPGSSPELLNLSIDATPPTLGQVDLAKAGDCYAAARQLYAKTSQLGVATVALREGYLSAARGDLGAWHAAASEAERVAVDADDRWLTALAATHRGLASIAMGEIAPVDELAALAARSHGEGGRGWVRGLVRLAVAQSTGLRDSGDLIAARRALQLARGMAEVSSAPMEVAEINDRLLELYGGHSFPGPRAILELAMVEQALSEPSELRDPVAWTQLGYRAQSAMELATRAIDGDVLIAAAPLLERLVAAAPPPPDSPDVRAAMALLAGVDPMAPESAMGKMDPIVAMSAMTALAAASLPPVFAFSAKQAWVMGPLYAGRSARRNGWPEDAVRWEARALAAAEGDDMAMLRTVVLGSIGRNAEALEIVDRLRHDPSVTAYLPQLYARLGAYDRALAVLPDTDPPSARPWEELALRAEIFAGAGRPSDAAAAADTGIESFEQSLARYARDVLKSSATEDLGAADLYLTRILVDAPAAAEGDANALRQSFAMSDRARSVSNLEPIGEGRDEPAVRRWLALGSEWAAAYEELGSMAASVAEIDVEALRNRLRDVESKLDDAEDELTKVAPDLLAASKNRRPPLDMAAVADALPTDALLLQYHCWNDQLLSWAMSADGLRFHRETVSGRDVASDCRRFLRAAFGGLGWDPDLDARLCALLLDPWTEVLNDHERVVIVPHGVLTGVPFHVIHHAGAFLGEGHVVSYAPSSSHLPRLAAASAPAHGSFVIGDPAYASTTRLRRLPGSGVEARYAAEVLAAEWVHTDASATKVAVETEAPGCSLVHLGTHGLLDERGPNRSTLALAGRDALSVADLLRLDVEGALVVLSACNSGRGRATAGGDVVGLIRALLASGAGSVVASSWPVYDEVGCVIMARFYDQLVAGADAAHALHRASAAVRTMSPDERHAAYQEIESRVGSRGRPAGPRDAKDPAAPKFEISDTAMWAPFVYVGR